MFWTFGYDLAEIPSFVIPCETGPWSHTQFKAVLDKVLHFQPNSLNNKFGTDNFLWIAHAQSSPLNLPTTSLTHQIMCS